MTSLLMIAEDRFEDAFAGMQAINSPREPELLIYLARQYSYIGAANEAIRMIRQSAEWGFVCAPETLDSDQWLGAARAHSDFPAVLESAAQSRENSRRVWETR